MARRLEEPNAYGGTTDHAEEIALLRYLAGELNSESIVVDLNLAADLLEAHDQTGISLDDWPFARRFVERYVGKSIIPNLI